MSYGFNALVNEPYPEVDDSGMSQLVDGTMTGVSRRDYLSGDGTNIGVAGFVIAAVAILLLLRLGGFRAMVAVSKA